MNNDLPMPMDHQELTPHWYWNAISTGGQNPMQPAVPQTATQEFGVMVPSPVGAMAFALSTDQVFGVGNHEPMPSHVPAMPCAPSTGPGAWCRKY